MRTLIFLLLTILAPGCDRDSAGGVAGASWDSKKDVAETPNYQGYISPMLSEAVIKNQCHSASSETRAGIAQHFEDIFRSFAFHLEGLEGPPVALGSPGLEASFVNREFLVKKEGEVLIRELLPPVFVMHPMWLGIDELGSVPVIMVANRSRASTGRYFVAIYMLDGTPLYRNVLIAWQVWDIKREANNIDILGCGETREIAMRGTSG